MKTILIDLDGTLLHMDQELFIKYYFETLNKNFNEQFNTNKFMDGLLAGTKAMVENDGIMTNEEMFWLEFEKYLSFSRKETHDFFEEFYNNDFDVVKKATKETPHAKELIDIFLKKGYQVIIATNPMFPKVASYKRVKWAGLDPEVFKEITTYENYHYCKPNVKYYQEILDKHNLKPENCIMIGNDIEEDLVAKNLGIDVCVVTDNLINRNNSKIDALFEGSIEELVQYIKNKA